jgi:hypothetical protein
MMFYLFILVLNIFFALDFILNCICFCPLHIVLGFVSILYLCYLITTQKGSIRVI